MISIPVPEVNFLSISGGTLTGNLLFSADNTLDIGASGATRPRTLYLGTSLISPSVGLTGNRITNGWFTDLTVTNAISGSITGNAATVTTNANLTGVVTSVGNATSIASGAIKANMLQSAASDLGAADVNIVLSNSNGSYVTNLTLDGLLSASNLSGSNTGDQKYFVAGIITLPSINDNGDGTVTLGTNGVAIFYTDSTGNSVPVSLNLSTGNTLTMTDGAINYIYTSYNSGSPIFASTTTPATLLADYRLCACYRVVREGTTLYITDYDNYALALSDKQLFKDISINGFQRQSGLALSTAATRISTVGSGVAWLGVQPYSLAENKAGTSGTLCQYYLVSGVWNKSTVTSYDSSYYSDGTDRQSLTSNRYVAKYFFRAVGSTNHACYVHGNQYTSFASALAEAVPSVPIAITSTSIYVGKIVIQEGATNGTAYPRDWGTAVVSATATDHSGLSNLLWTSSGHVGTASNIAGFDGTGIASLYTLSGTGTVLALTNSPAFVTPNIGNATGNISGNAGTVTNGLYTNTGLLLDQTTPQSIINGKPTVQGFIFNTNPTVGAFTEGKLYYDYVYKTLSCNIDADVNLQVGQETMVRAVNNTGSNMLNGQVVYLSGASGVFPTIALCKSDALATSYAIGLLTQNINAAAEGFVTVRGVVHDVDTSAWNAGDDLFVSDTTAGALTNVAPSPPSVVARVGRVIVKDATVGSIYVNPRQINQLSAMSDTQILSPSLDQVLRYNGSVWVNGAPATSSASAGIDFYIQTPVILPRVLPLGRTQDGTAGNGIQISSLGKTPITSLSGTVTISNASPAVVTWNAHGLPYGAPIVFTTTGALPSPLVAGTTYYVLDSATGYGTNTFQLGTTRTSTTGINTTDAGSGVHTATVTEIQLTAYVANDTRLTSAWLYNTALGRTSIDAGLWDFTTFAAVDSTSGGRSTTLTRQMCQVVPPSSGTVTITGAGANSRTATITSGQFTGTYFAASATNTSASYLQTPSGIFQITAKASNNEVTITVPTGYSNESAVTFNIWNKLFSVTSTPITSTGTNYAQVDMSTAQAAFTIAATDKLGQLGFVTGTVAGGTTVTLAYNGSSHNTHVSTPLITLHNNLAGLQGGTSNEYYHLTSSSYTVNGIMKGNGAGVFTAASAGSDYENPLTFGSGLTRTVNAVANDLITGKSGGQTIIGGTQTTDALTYKTTTGVGTTGADHIFQVGNNGATEAMRILNSGFIGIGTTTPATNFHVASSLTSSPRGIMSSQHNTGTDGARIHGRKSRGTNTSPTTVVTGDMLTRWVGSGYDGTSYLEMASIDFMTTGTIGTNRIPTLIKFNVATDASPSVMTEVMNLTTSALNILASTAATDEKTGALVVAGGVGITGQTFIKNYLTIGDSYAVKTPALYMKSGLPLVIKDPAGVNVADFSYVDGALSVYGTGTSPAFSNMRINTWNTVDAFIQNNIINLSSAANASADWIATTTDGSDSGGFVDLGINGSGFSVAGWTINGARDAYLYSKAISSNGGNLAIGTADAGKVLSLFTGGTLAANERMRITDSGIRFGSGAASYLYDFSVTNSTLTDVVFIGNATGLVGVPTAGDTLSVQRVVSSGSTRALVAGAEGSHTVNTSNAVQGLNAFASSSAGSTANYSASSGGLRNNYGVYHRGSGTVTETRTVNGIVSVGITSVANASTITYATIFNAQNPVYALYSGTPYGVITNFYQFRAQGGAIAGATLTNRYALYIEDLVAGTNRYGIYQAGSSDLNYFAGKLSLGVGTPAAMTNCQINIYNTVTSYFQSNIQNLSSNASASSDLVATCDDGTDTTGFVNMGINSSGFSSGSWTINGARDGYLYAKAAAGGGGNLSIGTADAKYLSFFTGGLLAANERARITSTGLVGIGTTAPDKQLEINSATGDCLRLTYNDSNGSAANYTDFAVSSSGDLTITPSGGNIVHASYTNLGSDAPTIKMKKLTGTTAAAEGGTATVAHGLTASKIIGVQASVIDASGNYVLPELSEYAGTQFNVYWGTTNFTITNHATNSENILSKAFTILVTYEE